MMPEKRIWELLARQFNHEITEVELQELQALLREWQDAHPHAELVSDLHSLSFKPGAEDKARKQHSLQAIREAIREKKAGEQALYEQETEVWLEKERLGSLRRKRILVRSGALTVCLLAALTGYLWLRPGSKSGNMAAEQFDRIATKKGSRTVINLRDSSSVTLNSACQFSYNKAFGLTRREMQLSGEAFFDIHKNPDMPLVIHAGNVLIRVLGTSFNIKAYPEDSFVEATLVKGLIEVSLINDPERKILLRSNEKIVIRQNGDGLPDKITDAAHKSREAEIAVTHIEPDPVDSTYIETAWLKDKMIFRKETLGALAKRMERWYNVRIVLADPELSNLVFTGSFEKEDLPQALKALLSPVKLSYKIEGQTVTIDKK